MDLRNIRIVAFDFDDTLCVHLTHIFPAGNQYTVQSISGTAFENCDTFSFMHVFVEWCAKQHMVLGLMSGTGFAVRAEAKVRWVEQRYKVRMQNWSVSSACEKCYMLESLSEAYKVPHGQILLVDDDFQTLVKAESGGFKALSPVALFSIMESDAYRSIFFGKTTCDKCASV